jgi:hypothetical protein
MAKALLSEPNEHQLSHLNPSFQEVTYLRSRLVELDQGWRESYLSFQTQALAEIDQLRSELRTLLEKHVEQDKKHRQEKERSDRAAFAIGLVVGIALSTAIASLLIRLA